MSTGESAFAVRDIDEDSPTKTWPSGSEGVKNLRLRM
jgi:hypothetical protein